MKMKWAKGSSSHGRDVVHTIGREKEKGESDDGDGAMKNRRGEESDGDERRRREEE